MLVVIVLVSCAPDSALPPFADVSSVAVRVEPDGLRFEVEITSPDTGCEQYADWWEVVDADGGLIHRRVLGHSHVDEQPFTRSGSPINIEPGQTVWVRAHMHPTGYGGLVMKGSIRDGFALAEPAPDFAADLASVPPLPDKCAF